MFSYLRPHHKRTTSGPSSPAETHSFEPPIHPIDHGHGHPPPLRWQDSPELTAPVSPYSTAALTRITSGGSEGSDSSRIPPSERDPRLQNWENSKPTARSRDIFAYNNRPRIPSHGSSQRPDSAGSAGPPSYTSSQNTLSPAMAGESITLRQKSPDLRHSFISAVDLQSNTTGKRPAGTRLATPPPTYNTSTFEPAPAKSGKARLNLLNPMSLLARRRTSHNITQLSAESLAASKATENENLDFRIRGTRVHDFSAPRPRKTPSYSDAVPESSTGNSSKPYQRSSNPQSEPTDDSGGWSGGNYTPVFTEDFEEEQYPAAGPHVRKAGDLTDLPLPKPPYAKGARRPVDLDLTPKSNNLSQKEIQTDDYPAWRISEHKPASDASHVLYKGQDRGPNNKRRISIEPASTPPKLSSSARKGRSRNVSEVSIKDAAIPKHMKSTSSRFSFDMIGAAEQEQLLEDRHRQRALEKQAEQANEEQEEGFEDEYDYDNMDDDDGLEERIPGVNADLDDDEDDIEERIPGINADLDDDDDFSERIPVINADLDENVGEVENFPTINENLSGFTFKQTWLPPLTPSTPGMAETPRDANGEVIGFAMTNNSCVSGDLADNSIVSPDPPRLPHLGSLVIDLPQRQKLQAIQERLCPISTTHDSPQDLKLQSFLQPTAIDDDDLYFDDGIITGPGDGGVTAEFDESIFDNNDTDQYGRPLRALSSITTPYSPLIATEDPSPALNIEAKNGPMDLNKTIEPISPENLPSPETVPRDGNLAPMPSILELNTKQNSFEIPTQNLTQDSLAAYQSALAAAAFTAAANGKFRRDSVPKTVSPSDQEDIQPGLDSSHTSHYEPFSPKYELEDDFDYDDALEDDDIIAAANAEALAYDYDGFYGQEFGFYSASTTASSQAEYANGGYFGPRGVEGLNRAQSGRVVSREPNLTPITERSEYSNRNSFMSLLSPNYGPGSVASPGLAQLAGMMSAQEFEGGDMSLGALLKLRRGAWGGSQPSLHSSNGSPKSPIGPGDASPIGVLSPWSQGSIITNPTNYTGHGRKNSGISAVSEAAFETSFQNDTDSRPASPTITLDLFKPDSEKELEENPFRKHKHSASAESISYMKEEDPITGERWILERRRTDESGEMELLKREVVKGEEFKEVLG